MIITTSLHEDDFHVEKAISIGMKYGLQYVSRQNRSLEYLFDHTDPEVFVVNESRGLSYYERGKNEAFFHPNMAFLRIKNLKKGEKDSLIEVCHLSAGMSFLDATLGLASDTLTASYVLGSSGICKGIEKSRSIYILVKEGLAFYAERHPEMNEIIHRIDIYNNDNLDFMKSCDSKSYDVVYFDFMFDSPNMKSKGIQMIRSYAAKDEMTFQHIEEAIRVSKKSVVVKCDKTRTEKLVCNGFEIMKENSKKSFYYVGYNM